MSAANTETRRTESVAFKQTYRSMTVGELVAQLQRLDQRAEIAVLSASAMARPPEITRVNPLAWNGHDRRSNFGFADASNAYLLRPAQEII